jgi:glyoxylase-like metal-dependent hydrolase (beta-lactamase superfamily II)
MLNCGTLLAPGYPTVVCRCLLIEDDAGLGLIDTGIGLRDVARPEERLGHALIDAAGFQFHEVDTAVRRIESLGYRPGQVNWIVLTHADPDHAGGLVDFPEATVDLAEEEWASVEAGHGRYVAAHFAHRPRVRIHGKDTRDWFGLEARPLDWGGSTEILLIPLFGHTLGHCGVAVRSGDTWLLHAGDAYCLQAELADADHPVSALAALRADDDAVRRASLEQLRRLARDHADRIDIVGYHDISEYPSDQPIGPMPSPRP